MRTRGLSDCVPCPMRFPRENATRPIQAQHTTFTNPSSISKLVETLHACSVVHCTLGPSQAYAFAWWDLDWPRPCLI